MWSRSGTCPGRQVKTVASVLSALGAHQSGRKSRPHAEAGLLPSDGPVRPCPVQRGGRRCCFSLGVQLLVTGAPSLCKWERPWHPQDEELLGRTTPRGASGPHKGQAGQLAHFQVFRRFVSPAGYCFFCKVRLSLSTGQKAGWGKTRETEEEGVGRVKGGRRVQGGAGAGSSAYETGRCPQSLIVSRRKGPKEEIFRKEGKCSPFLK